ncbi:hypothetical protein [Corynebacterium simulans]|uniref:hypothetical protein n=1 Tax=Corynebacterium TaxID=1716 RepID=UPI0020044F22|nr:hypothetical protein [Corynebacterium simulans]MCK6161887.1 hypothetical protein [Corynebacterium simulans]
MHKLSSLLLSLPLAATLLLTGCSNGSDNSEHSSEALPETSFSQAAGATQSDARSTSSEDTAKEHQGPQPTLGNSGEGANAQAASGAAANPDTQSGSNTYPNGDAIASTDCYDFPADITVRPGSMSSCAYVAELYKAATAATYTYSQSNPHVTAVPKTTVTVTSPTTDQTYNVDCRIGSAGDTLTCEKDGDRNSGASFTVNSGPFWHGRVTIL